MAAAAWYNTDRRQLAIVEEGEAAMFGSVKQLQQMQQKMMKVQDELANETVEVTAGGGAVKIVITGNQTVKSVRIDPDAVDPADVAMLEDLIVAAVNEAVTKSQDLASKKMAAVTGNLRIPGM
jgi:nucleoid-associated protein EbfC